MPLPLLLLMASTSVTARIFPKPGYINPWQIEYNLYFGEGKDIDISKMFFLPPIDAVKPDEQDIDGEVTVVRSHVKNGPAVFRVENPAMLDLEQNYQLIKERYMFKDFDDNLEMEKEFLEEFPNRNDLTEKIQNVSQIIKDYRRRMVSRRSYVGCSGSCYLGWKDPTDPDWNDWQKENQKRVMIIDLMLAFLIHMRYKMKEAMAIRYLVRNDKRYMIGYNFNRIRRLMYDLKKLFTSQILLETDDYQKDFLTQAIVHRHFIRLETDCRDTINNIIHIYWNQIEPVTFNPQPKYRRPTKASKKPKIPTTRFVPGGG